MSNARGPRLHVLDIWYTATEAGIAELQVFPGISSLETLIYYTYISDVHTRQWYFYKHTLNSYVMYYIKYCVYKTHTPNRNK